MIIVFQHFIEDDKPVMWVPLSTMSAVVCTPPASLEVSLYTRDFRFFLFEFSSQKEIARFTRFASPYIQGLVPTERSDPSTLIPFASNVSFRESP